ncbi:MAG: LEA type 2 family protein [Pseudomonadota bacterium]|nr:LEA type 2 family protein [Pseudomonadota bacterium]
MQYPIRWAACLIALFALILGGCTGMLNRLVEEPEIRLQEIRILEVGLVSQRYRLVLEIYNPNSVAMPVERISYQVDLAGQSFANGETTEPFTVPARGRALFHTDVRTNLLEFAGQMANLLSNFNGELDYHIQGEVEVDLPFTDTVPFERKGTVQLYRGGD